MSSKARKAATNKKRARRAPKVGRTAVDRRLLAKAKLEEAGDGGFPCKYVSEQLVKACDQLGRAIAVAQQAGDLEGVENLTPVLATLWSTRMELGETVGGAQ